jgi:hypothetical protein
LCTDWGETSALVALKGSVIWLTLISSEHILKHMMEKALTNFAIWLLKLHYTSVFISLGRNHGVSKIENGRIRGKAMSFANRLYAEGEIEEMRAMFASIFIERPNFMSDIIIPALEDMDNVVKENDIEEMVDKKIKKTVN